MEFAEEISHIFDVPIAADDDEEQNISSDRSSVYTNVLDWKTRENKSNFLRILFPEFSATDREYSFSTTKSSYKECGAVRFRPDHASSVSLCVTKMLECVRQDDPSADIFFLIDGTAVFSNIFALGSNGLDSIKIFTEQLLKTLVENQKHNNIFIAFVQDCPFTTAETVDAKIARPKRYLDAYQPELSWNDPHILCKFASDHPEEYARLPVVKEERNPATDERDAHVVRVNVHDQKSVDSQRGFVSLENIRRLATDDPLAFLRLPFVDKARLLTAPCDDTITRINKHDFDNMFALGRARASVISLMIQWTMLYFQETKPHGIHMYVEYYETTDDGKEFMTAAYNNGSYVEEEMPKNFPMEGEFRATMAYFTMCQIFKSSLNTARAHAFVPWTIDTDLLPIIMTMCSRDIITNNEPQQQRRLYYCLLWGATRILKSFNTIAWDTKILALHRSPKLKDCDGNELLQRLLYYILMQACTANDYVGQFGTEDAKTIMMWLEHIPKTMFGCGMFRDGDNIALALSNPKIFREQLQRGAIEDFVKAIFTTGVTDLNRRYFCSFGKFERISWDRIATAVAEDYHHHLWHDENIDRPLGKQAVPTAPNREVLFDNITYALTVWFFYPVFGGGVDERCVDIFEYGYTVSAKERRRKGLHKKYFDRLTLEEEAANGALIVPVVKKLLSK
jgi:hypothetical protein